MRVNPVDGYGYGYSGAPKVPPGHTVPEKQLPVAPPPSAPPNQTPPQKTVEPKQQEKSAQWVNNYYTTFTTSYDNRQWNTVNLNFSLESNLRQLQEFIEEQRKTLVLSYGLWALSQRPFWSITPSTPFWGSSWSYDYNRTPYKVTPPAIIDLFA